MELIQEIGSYAGFAAVVGLAVLSALYFSQARDVRRLREWAGRAPERAAEIEAGGRAAAAVPVAARPQPQVKPAQEGAATAAAPAAAATAAPAAAASAGAAAASAAGPKPATAAAPGTAVNGTEEDADDDLDPAEEPETSAAPAAATPAGAVASGAGTAERPAAAPGGTTAGDTGTGVKVLPPRRTAPPVRPRPTIPPRAPVPPRTGKQSVLGQAPGSRPPQRGGRNWPAPRYIALIIGAIVILGLGGTVGVLQLTKEDTPQDQGTPETQPDTNVAPDQPDQPEPAQVNPADVTVAVLNATATTGLAARVGSQLEGEGFQTGNLTNAADRQRAESVVMFKPGRNDEARAVSRRLDIGSIEPIDGASESLAGDAMVVVVLGADKAQE